MFESSAPPNIENCSLKLTEGSEQKAIKKDIKAKRVGHTENNARETKVPVNNKHHAQEAGK